MKIFITGGHLTPALGFMEYALSVPGVELVFAGRKWAQQELSQISYEEQEVLGLGVRFVAFETGKAIVRANFIEAITQTSLFFRGLWQSWRLLAQEKPDVLLSFGSYMAVPFALMAYVMGIPVVTHEQTSVVGVANQIVAKLARKVAISFSSSSRFFSSQKVVLTGNPIRDALLSSQTVPPSWLPPANTRPIFYLSGGSQGSRTLNELLVSVLPELLTKYLVVHQYGRGNDAQSQLASSSLSADQRSSYISQARFDVSDLAWIYRHAQVVMTRSGANTVHELLATHRPAIFIPLFFAHHNEQLANAQSIVDGGGGLLLSQDKLSETTFWEVLGQFESQRSNLQDGMKKLGQVTIVDGGRRLFEVVSQVVSEGGK